MDQVEDGTRQPTTSSRWAKKKKKKKKSKEEDVLLGYEAGRRSCADVVRAARAYRGREKHWLWERLSLRLVSAPPGKMQWYDNRFEFVFEALPEEKMFELLKALTEDDPDFPLKRHVVHGYFLHAALKSMERTKFFTYRSTNVSSRALLLLAVKGTTRVREGGYSHRTPLAIAFGIPRIQLEVIDHLLELDPGVLDLRPLYREQPLFEIAFRENAENIPVLTRLVETRPDLLLRKLGRSSPIHHALYSAPVSAQVANFLETTINRYPETVSVLVDQTPLHYACLRFHQYPHLLRTVIRARPALLGLRGWLTNRSVLPIEILAQQRSPNLALVEEETFHLALAFVELAFEGPIFRADDGTHEQALESHVRGTAAAFLPFLRVEDDGEYSRSGYVVALAIRELGNRLNFCRALFDGGTHLQMEVCQRGSRWLKTLEGVYRMNRRGRSNPSLAHQVELLASVNDDLDCTYLQLRLFAGRAMSQRVSTWTRRKRPREDLD